MKYLGNFKDWIDDSLLSVVQSSEGERITIGQIKSISNSSNIGYSTLNTSHSIFTHNTKELSDFTVAPPIEIENKSWTWWFSKFYPGSFTHMGYVYDIDLPENHIKYIMALTDYVPGHMFLYEGGYMITNYKAGDLWRCNIDQMYGRINLSMTDSIMFEFAVA